jgi:4-carboxymuconolactone decarboxylase
MDERLEHLPPDRLDDVQAVVYDEIVGGRRAAGPQLFPMTREDGSLNGPFNALLHAPAVGGPLAAVGEAVRFATSLTPRVREIAILIVAAHRGSRFEWYAHERIGQHVGLTAEELAGIRSLAGPPLDDPGERAAFALARDLVRDRTATEATYDAAVAALGQTQVVELTLLVGYYDAVALLLAAFRVGLPEDPEPGQAGAATP